MATAGRSSGPAVVFALSVTGCSLPLESALDVFQRSEEKTRASIHPAFERLGGILPASNNNTKPSSSKG